MSEVNQLLKVNYSEFSDIVSELKRLPIEINKYRDKVGLGRSQCFGIVSKRSAHPDISRQSWRRPFLHHLLMEYASKYVPIPFTSIQVNQDMICEEHKDRGNVGLSYIVAFSDENGFEGGNLWVEGFSYDINCSPLLFDGSMMRHKTEPFRGTRYSIVYHTLLPRPSYTLTTPPLKDYEVVIHEGVWKIKCKDGKYLWGKNGLPHPLRGRKKTV